jgi:hypothetical protein
LLRCKSRYDEAFARNHRPVNRNVYRPNTCHDELAAAS